MSVSYLDNHVQRLNTDAVSGQVCARVYQEVLTQFPEDFRYWEAMQKKYMDFKTKVDITTNDKEILPTTEIANMLGKILGEEDDSIPTTDTK